MNILDIILILILLLSILFGILKGFIRELFSLAFFIIAVVLSFLFYHEVGGIFMSYLKNRDVSNFAGFITIFVVVLIAGAVVTFFVKRVFAIGPLEAIDKILGGLFGLLRGILISAIIVLALIVFPVNHSLIIKSKLSPYVIKTIEVVIHFLPAKYKEKINNIKDGLK
ncbi:MAG: CvpA family protein [Candidatus Aminicenantes bacterium]|nr:MAG: CvpA family protein [Candidatus Aminicenantes bacterium]